MIENLSSHLINRAKEISLIIECLDSLLNHETTPEPVLFFHGVARVGKTRLLHECQQLAAARGIPVAFVDFDREHIHDGESIDRRYEGEPGKVQLASHIIGGLIQTADAPTNRPIKATDDIDVVVEKLLEYIAWLQGFLKKPVVLLFDTLEESPRDTFLWLQEKILTPLLERQQVFIAFASWSPPRESAVEFRWSVARHMRAQALKPFTEDQTLEHLHLLGASRWLGHPNVNRITGGLPGLNEVVFTVQADTELELLRQMVHVIFDRMGENAEVYRAELLALSAFRQFDTRLLEYILKKLWIDKYYSLDRRSTRETLKLLRKTVLVEQHPDGYGYVVPSDVRVVLDYYQRKHNVELHLQIHCLAAIWFRVEVENNDVVSVADELYHLAGAWRDIDESNGQLKIPPESGLPDGHERLTQLKGRLAFGLSQLKDHKRAHELVDKIGTVLKGKEFQDILSESEVKALLAQCAEFELEK
jgi:hypothetical protein